MSFTSHTIELSDRARGCIVGGAIGDAMGGPFEGRPGPLLFYEHNDWTLSDDSQLTLATCESIIQVGSVTAEHIAARFVTWYRAQRITGMGASTLKALRDLDAGAHWALAGAKGEMAAGNGAAMRVAPLAFYLDPSVDHDRRLIRDVCRITHHNEEAYVGALAIVVAIRSLAFWQLSRPDALLQNLVGYLPDSRVKDRIAELIGLPNDLTITEIAGRYGSSGYVVDSVPLALYAARFIAELPLQAIFREVIEAGGDTDTVASMAGQIAGAWLGASNISQNLIDSLPKSIDFERITSEFALTV